MAQAQIQNESSGPHMLTLDASAPVPPAQPADYDGGTDRTPDGRVLGVTNRYLTLDGKPWIPVMGEMHYAREPEADWDADLARLKASGVDVVSTYIIWIYHEEVQGQWDWSGRRDLRHFAELCQKHGLLLMVRIGPWAHAETRNGGLPDWVVKAGPTRQMDPVFLAETRLFDEQIGTQLHGLLWKDGGPVIGVQIENEYARRGPGEGTPYILALKAMARQAGLDVPLYTVTGWDHAVVPPHEFLPVYGGYPAAPWGGTDKAIGPQEVYTFRFGSRVSGNMGMIGAGTSGAGQEPAVDDAKLPFLTAEVGGGIEDTYHRRPVIAADDIAAMVPVMLGSGVNGYGTYMMVGGEDPKGKLTTLQESQATGYPTDVPVKSYDFQAPIGQFGRERRSLRLLKEWNYFMQDYGPLLAPMPAFAPSVRPKSPADLSVLRWSVRTDGQAGFLFVNDYARGSAMPAYPGTQFELTMPAGHMLRIPSTPIDVPSGAYFAWPFGLSLDGVPLRYATAQLMARLGNVGSGHRSTFVFLCTRGVRCELALEGTHWGVPSSPGYEVTSGDGVTLLRPGRGARTDIALRAPSGRQVHFLLLSSSAAADTWMIPDAHGDRLLETAADVSADGDKVTLRQLGDPDFHFSLYPEQAGSPASISNIHRDSDGTYSANAEPEHFTVRLKLLRGAGAVSKAILGPAFSWRPVKVGEAPSEDVWAKDAARWSVELDPPHLPSGISNVFLRIRYAGDEARLLANGELLDDNFFNGEEWMIGLRRYAENGDVPAFTLELLPMHADPSIYLAAPARTQLSTSGQTLRLGRVSAVPQFQLQFQLPSAEAGTP
jgi:beta-galactosidase